MPFSLPQLAAAQGLRRSVDVRPIHPPQTLAQELFAVYRPVLNAWVEGAPGIMAAYEQTLSQLTTDSPADIDRNINDVAGAIERLILVLTPALRSWAVRVEKWHRGRWTDNVYAASSIQLETMLTANDVAETVDVVVQRNVALLKDVSAQARGRISDAVFRGVQQRRPANDVARDIREAVTMSRDRSRRIASDQLRSLTSRLDQERQEQAGIDKYRWKSSHKLHYRPEHRAREDKIFEWAKPPEDGPPGTLINCGCRAQAWIDLS